MLADDITAATFEKCWRSISTFEPQRTTVRPWLFRVAANELASHFRAEHRRGAREHLVAVRERPLRQQHDHEELVGDDEELVAAMSRLRDRDQTVLALRFLADLTTEEAAMAMEVERSHFAVLQHRALAALRRELEGTRHG